MSYKKFSASQKAVPNNKPDDRLRDVPAADRPAVQADKAPPEGSSVSTSR